MQNNLLGSSLASKWLIFNDDYYADGRTELLHAENAAY